MYDNTKRGDLLAEFPPISGGFPVAVAATSQLSFVINSLAPLTIDSSTCDCAVSERDRNHFVED